ncbi:MAG: hypothetical protein ACI4FZ_04955 [Lachnospiraceae bacterium]
MKTLVKEHNGLQSTVETIYRVNADDYARAEIEAREDYLRQQRTIQNEMDRLNAELAEKNATIADKDQEIFHLRSLLKQNGIKY